MGIPFPKMHIAASAINRIMNAVEGEKSLGFSATDMISPPTTPDPGVEGAMLDTKIATPVAPADVPPDQAPQAEQSAEATSALGGSPFDGALMGLSGPAG
jgi:hypothetical protein